MSNGSSTSARPFPAFPGNSSMFDDRGTRLSEASNLRHTINPFLLKYFAKKRKEATEVAKGLNNVVLRLDSIINREEMLESPDSIIKEFGAALNQFLDFLLNNIFVEDEQLIDPYILGEMGNILDEIQGLIEYLGQANSEGILFDKNELNGVKELIELKITQLRGIEG